MNNYKCLLLTLLFSTFSHATEWVNEAPYTTIAIPKMILEKRSWYTRLDAFSSPKPGALLGGGVIIGKQFEIVTLDAQVKFLTGTYETITPDRDLAALDDALNWPVSTDPNAEINSRNRTAVTAFTGLLFGPAVGFHGKLLQFISPKLTEMGRVGAYYGNFTDGVNAISFSAVVVFAEASIFYQLSNDGAWTLGGSISANSGRMQYELAETGVKGRIPVLFGNVGLNLSYWF
ncbi:MAG: hypothetical protein KA715_02715 [Xanthomonadaceae bacterium]|nr:hypothetical protein [Xanthomonadaceae bacterium]